MASTNSPKRPRTVSLMTIAHLLPRTAAVTTTQKMKVPTAALYLNSVIWRPKTFKISVTGSPSLTCEPLRALGATTLPISSYTKMALGHRPLSVFVGGTNKLHRRTLTAASRLCGIGRDHERSKRQPGQSSRFSEHARIAGDEHGPGGRE